MILIYLDIFSLKRTFCLDFSDKGVLFSKSFISSRANLHKTYSVDDIGPSLNGNFFNKGYFLFKLPPNEIFKKWYSFLKWNLIKFKQISKNWIKIVFPCSKKSLQACTKHKMREKIHKNPKKMLH